MLITRICPPARQIGADTPPRLPTACHELNRELSVLYTGRLTRMVLDVEQGALYHYEISREHSRHLIAVPSTRTTSTPPTPNSTYSRAGCGASWDFPATDARRCSQHLGCSRFLDPCEPLRPGCWRSRSA